MKTVKMKVPEGGGNVSFDGREYQVGAGGVIEVPEGAVMYLAQYGYTHAATAAAGGKQDAAEADADGKKPAAKPSKQATAKQ